MLGLIDYETAVQVNLAAVVQGRKMHRAVVHQSPRTSQEAVPAERSRFLYLKLGKSDGAVAVIHQFWKHLAEDLELEARQTREQCVVKLSLQWRAVTNDHPTASEERTRGTSPFPPTRLDLW